MDPPTWDEPEPAAPDIAVTPTSVDFGDVPVGGASDYARVLIDNVGDEVLHLVELELEGEVEAFELTAELVEIPPLWDSVAWLRFLPDRPRPFGAALRVVSDDPDEPEVFIPLEGVGFDGG